MYPYKTTPHLSSELGKSFSSYILINMGVYLPEPRWPLKSIKNFMD